MAGRAVWQIRVKGWTDAFARRAGIRGQGRSVLDTCPDAKVEGKNGIACEGDEAAVAAALPRTCSPRSTAGNRPRTRSSLPWHPRYLQLSRGQVTPGQVRDIGQRPASWRGRSRPRRCPLCASGGRESCATCQLKPKGRTLLTLSACAIWV